MGCRTSRRRTYTGSGSRPKVEIEFRGVPIPHMPTQITSATIPTPIQIISAMSPIITSATFIPCFGRFICPSPTTVINCYTPSRFT